MNRLKVSYLEHKTIHLLANLLLVDRNIIVSDLIWLFSLLDGAKPQITAEFTGFTGHRR